jgi:hypothetical protein
MDFGDRVGLLIDISCRKKNKAILDMDERLAEKLIEAIF